jgi:hypothetical protein
MSTQFGGAYLWKQEECNCEEASELEAGAALFGAILGSLALAAGWHLDIWPPSSSGFF